MSDNTIQQKALHPETGSVASSPSAVDEEILDQVRTAVEGAEEKKAEEIRVLRLTAITEFTDYFVICSGSSTRQNQAIADEISDRLKLIGLRPLHTEGFTTAEWILLDYGTFIVHIFTTSAREFYDLERLWRDAERVV
ncbi:MAG: ribosome silencing factor [Acidobacteria bacterium]|nr:ribosome silencing factor [Acidobacteriota bacterium]